jgi:hypothetical protein
VRAFHTYQDAADWMEAVDVVDGEYHGYDADGYVLSFATNRDDVLICRTSERAYEEAIDQFRSALSTSPIALDNSTLQGMICQMLDLEASSGLRHWTVAMFDRLRHLRRKA